MDIKKQKKEVLSLIQNLRKKGDDQDDIETKAFQLAYMIAGEEFLTDEEIESLLKAGE